VNMRDICGMLGLLVDPRIPMPPPGEGIRPFSLVSDGGMAGEITVAGFQGNRRLAAYIDGVYYVTNTLFRLVELVAIALPTLIFDGKQTAPITTGYLFHSLGRVLVQESEEALPRYHSISNVWQCRLYIIPLIDVALAQPSFFLSLSRYWDLS
jgi:hypothetical protein